MSLNPEELISVSIARAQAGATGDLPIAASIFDSQGQLICSEKNAVISNSDPTAHAEIRVLRTLGLIALRQNAQSLTIAVTLEPCPMCAWAIRASGLGRIIFGAYSPQYGSAGTVFDLLRDRRFGRPLEVIGGVLEDECARLLGAAFSEIRDNSQR